MTEQVIIQELPAPKNGDPIVSQPTEAILKFRDVEVRKSRLTGDWIVAKPSSLSGIILVGKDTKIARNVVGLYDINIQFTIKYTRP